jgi:hypothetical protein
MSPRLAAAGVPATLLLLLLGASPVVASGTYRGAPPRPATTLDVDKYEAGKRLFTGVTAPKEAATSRARQQASRLAALQARLPRAARGTDLNQLAGRLDPEQMEALEYFLKVRYKVRAS